MKSVLIVSQRLFTAWREEDLHIVIPSSVSVLSGICCLYMCNQLLDNLYMIWGYAHALVCPPDINFFLFRPLKGAYLNLLHKPMTSLLMTLLLMYWQRSLNFAARCQLGVLCLSTEMLRNSFCFCLCHNSLRYTAVC